MGRSHRRALGAITGRHPGADGRTRDRLELAAPVSAGGRRPGRNPPELPRRRADARERAGVPRLAAVAAGSVGMPGLIHLVLDETDRANPANHRPAVRTGWEIVDCSAR